MMFGWVGKILHIDLSTYEIWEEQFPLELGKKFLGSRGINAKILWDLIKEPGIDPLSPMNPLIFGTGPLTGTSAPSSGRTTITCKGPLTHRYLKTNMGGSWGAELKFAGYDHLIIHGASEKPVYILIKDDEVDIKDASHLWGLDVRQTTERLKKEHNDLDLKVATIGPAGEHLVLYASIMNSIYNAAGRGGAGAVMGSKKLKAIAVRGTGEVAVKDPKKFSEVALRVRRAFYFDPFGLKYYLWGTGGFVAEDREVRGSALIEPVYMLRGGKFKRRHACFSCSMACHRYIELDRGPYAGTFTCGPEVETVGSLGRDCGNVDFETLVKANDLANILGLDTISVGKVIAWAMESYERGLLGDYAEDLNLEFGNDKALIELLPMIAYRKGKLGNLLADGTKRAADKIGKDSSKWAIQQKGLEDHGGTILQSRGSYVLGCAVNPRGPDHLSSQPLPSFGGQVHHREKMEEITGDRWPGPMLEKNVPLVTRWHEDMCTSLECLGFCIFIGISALAASFENMAQMFSFATGIDLSKDELRYAARRVFNIEKAFNVQEGFERIEDYPPWRYTTKDINDPDALNGYEESKAYWDRILDAYYSLHEWDLKTGWPYKETLVKLNLEEVAERLEKIGKVP
jgi:aldehyde:ferredoxin oxidoreductase